MTVLCGVLSPECGKGGNHLSALNMIGAQHAEACDADLVLEVLRGAATNDVRGKAVWMAYGVLDNADTKDQRIVDALFDLLADASVCFYTVKETAVRVLAETLGRQADDILLRLLRGDDGRLQAHAAWYLVRDGGLDRYREELVDVAESWGDRPPTRHEGDRVIEKVRQTAQLLLDPTPPDRTRQRAPRRRIPGQVGHDHLHGFARRRGNRPVRRLR